MTNFACVKPCKYCTVMKRCPRIRQPEQPGKAPRERKWNPNDGSEDATLQCGDTIPWPVIQAFGQHIHGRIWCSAHGWQPRITKKDIDKANKTAKRHNAGTLLNPFGTDDAPPF